jgi:hypothetical protein
MIYVTIPLMSLYPLFSRKIFIDIICSSVIPWLFSLAKVMRESLWLEQASFIANLRKYNADNSFFSPFILLALKKASYSDLLL